MGLPSAAGAQDLPTSDPPTAATVRGRIVTPAGTDVKPIAGVHVTVHRVGPDAAGPLDSMVTGADGRYAIGYTRSGSRDAVYFAAVVFRGIAYFSAPLTTPHTREDDGVIVVFDTTTAAIPFGTQGHHVIVSAPGPDGSRKVMEVYELSNDTSVTVVGRDSLAAVWSAPLPRGASDFAAGQGDVAAAGLVVRDGRVAMLAPFGPGIKQLSFTYTLAPRHFPLEITLEHETGLLEVLLEEQAAQARAPSLRAQPDASTQGRTFKRLLGQGAPKGERLRIDVPVVEARTRERVLVGVAVVIGLAMAAALARALMRRGSSSGAPVPPPPAPNDLAAAIAALDARREAGDPTLGPDAYATQRASLKGELAAALDRERALR